MSSYPGRADERVDGTMKIDFDLKIYYSQFDIVLIDVTWPTHSGNVKLETQDLPALSKQTLEQLI